MAYYDDPVGSKHVATLINKPVVFDGNLFYYYGWDYLALGLCVSSGSYKLMLVV
jgi:hypothetical protein